MGAVHSYDMNNFTCVCLKYSDIILKKSFVVLIINRLLVSKEKKPHPGEFVTHHLCQCDFYFFKNQHVLKHF